MGKIYDGPGKGRKQCCVCNKYIHARNLKCCSCGVDLTTTRYANTKHSVNKERKITKQLIKDKQKRLDNLDKPARDYCAKLGYPNSIVIFASTNEWSQPKKLDRQSIINWIEEHIIDDLGRVSYITVFTTQVYRLYGFNTKRSKKIVKILRKYLK